MSILKEISEGISKVDSLIGEVAEASTEQATGIDQLNEAVSQIDQVTQQNAAMAEESSSASEELTAQSTELLNIVGELKSIVYGSSAQATNSANSEAYTSTRRKTKMTSIARTQKTKHDEPKDIIPLYEEEMANF